MAIPSAINGQSGTVQFSSTTFSVGNWNAKIGAEVLDTTTVQSNGWQDNIAGIKSVEGSFEMPLDTSVVPTGVLSAGASGTFTLTIGNTAKSLTGTGRIKDMTIKNEARGVVTFSCNFVSTGSWTLPS